MKERKQLQFPKLPNLHHIMFFFFPTPCTGHCSNPSHQLIANLFCLFFGRAGFLFFSHYSCQLVGLPWFLCYLVTIIAWPMVGVFLLFCHYSCLADGRGVLCYFLLYWFHQAENTRGIWIVDIETMYSGDPSITLDIV